MAEESPLKGNGMRVAVHYGCQYVRLSKHRPSISVEYPELLDKLIESLGFKSVYYVDKHVL